MDSFNSYLQLPFLAPARALFIACVSIAALKALKTDLIGDARAHASACVY